MSNRLIQFVMPRWPLVALVLATPLLVTGAFAWLTSDDSTTPARRLHLQPVAEPGPQPLPHSLQFDRSLDRSHQRELVQAEVEKRRAATPLDRIALGQALLQLGKLEQALANSESANAAFDEVQAVHEDPLHWQSREALLRNDVSAKLRHVSPADHESWQQAANCYDEAVTLHLAGHYRAAVDRAEQALTLRRRLWGNEHLETAESLLQLAWYSTEHAAFYLRAEGLAREAFDRLQKILGAAHPAQADCLYVLALLADDRGEFDGAEGLYEDALAIYRNSIGMLSGEFARTLSRQGRMHNTWWKDYGAGKSFRAQQIRDQIFGPEHPDSAESLEDLAEFAYSMRSFPRAERLLRQAIEIREKSQGSAHPDLARPQSLLAASMAAHGDVSQAEVNIHHALFLTERTRGMQHPCWARQRLLMGVLQIRTAYDFAGGYRMLQQVQEVLRDLGLQRHPLYCQAIFEQADGMRAERGTHLDDSESINLSAARRRMENAIAAYRLLPEYDRFAYFAEALAGLHDLYFYQNYAGVDRETVRALITELERVIHDNGGAANPIWSMIPYVHGRFAMSEGDYVFALENFADHIRRVRRQYGDSHPWAYGAALHGLTGCLVHQGADLAQAHNLANQSFDVYLNFLRRNAAGQSDLSRLSTLHECFYQVSSNLCVGELLGELPAEYDKVLAIRGLAGAFQISDHVAHDHDELAPLQQAVGAARRAMKTFAFEADLQEATGDWIGRFQRVSDHKEFAESELALATRPYVAPEPVLTWQELQEALPPRTAFVDFVQFIHHESPPGHRGRMVRELRMLAFILKKSGPPECVQLGSSHEIAHQVEAWRKALSDFQKGIASDLDGPTRKLARSIWNPILARLPEIDNLYIAPDGPLCFVSFAALPGRQPGRYALEDFAISYVNSGRLLYQQLKSDHPAHGTGLLACGDIEYQRTNPNLAEAQAPGDSPERLLSSSAKWNNLAATRLEIDRVAELHSTAAGGESRIMELSGSNIDAARLTTALSGKWRTVHFAGHGFFIDPANAQFLSGQYFETAGQSRYFLQRHQLLLSGLVLAPDPRQPGEPTVLTAEEVGSLDMRGTDLVVLSACETGLGCSAGADGVLGLTRAFLTAGSRSVVSSLWKVEDSATSLLMEEFYKNLWERPGFSKAQALRQAQLTVLNYPGRVSERSQDLALRGFQPGKSVPVVRGVASAGRSHPALWAAFVLNGDAR